MYTDTIGKSIKDSLQEQLIVTRRNQILDAATKVFAENGFHPTTIKDIARQAGIADGTIYIYFENKTALMLGILDRMNETEQRDVDFSQFTEGDFRSLMKAYIKHSKTLESQWDALPEVLTDMILEGLGGDNDI